MIKTFNLKAARFPAYLTPMLVLLRPKGTFSFFLLLFNCYNVSLHFFLRSPSLDEEFEVLLIMLFEYSRLLIFGR